jgi:hypothetical protein
MGLGGYMKKKYRTRAQLEFKVLISILLFIAGVVVYDVARADTLFCEGMEAIEGTYERSYLLDKHVFVLHNQDEIIFNLNRCTVIINKHSVNI